MSEKCALSDQQIGTCIKAHYGIEVASLTPLSWGADMVASVYRATACDQSSYFVKLKEGPFHDMGVTVQTYLYEAGVHPIIPPIKTIDGHLTHRINDFTLILYPFVQGEDGFGRTLTEAQWGELGKILRQIHTLRVPSSLQEQIRREAFSPQWRNAVRSFYTDIKSREAWDEIAQKFKAFMEEKAALILRLVERSERLAQELYGQSHPFVLCHSDIHGGNVLIAENGSIYVVDWDDPIMAPKERDLMFIGGGVGNVWNNSYEVKAFYQGYGEVNINQDLLAYYRCERIVEDIALYCQQVFDPASEDQARLKSYEYFISQFDAHGVVEIALNTTWQRECL